MLKKRLIFTLIYSDRAYMLSRNFRLQRVGDIHWINKNYNFPQIATALDELIVVDATKTKKQTKEFLEQLKLVVDSCFIPVAAGGGIDSLAKAELLLNSGADKLIINTVLYTDPALVKELVKIYGKQCIIASVDYKMTAGHPEVYIRDGTLKIDIPFAIYIQKLVDLGVGELYLNSIDKDGTGQAYALEVFNFIPSNIDIPIIMAGGAGNHIHLIEGIAMPHVDAVATANLFNFIGNGIPFSRKCMVDSGIKMSHWDSNDIFSLRNYFGGELNTMTQC